MRHSTSDEQLLAATAGDPEAFGRFYRRHEKLVIGYLMRRVRDAEVAADLAAEVFASALEAAPGYRSEGATATPWLLTIAHNVLVSSARHGRVQEQARRRVGMLAEIELRRESMHRIETALAGDEWVAHVLEQLPATERDAVRARVLDDRSYEEIAATLQTSSLVVRKRVSRGLARLRAELERRP